MGVLTPLQHSWYSIPVSIILKKEGTVRFIADYLRLNQKFVRNIYPLPRTSETMQNLEGIQYTTILDLNMRYYTIRLSLASHNTTTIVTEFGRFRYNSTPTGMCASGDIFQANVDDILGDIYGVKMYKDYIIVLSKGCFANNI